MNTVSPGVFDSVEEAIRDFKAGKLVIVTDDEGRENEGDLVMAAELATPKLVTMMIRYCSGIICVPATGGVLKRLGLGPMVQQNREALRTDFTASVDAATGVTTGISAADRTRAIRILADPNAKGEELVQPGHVFPLRARPGGVLERAGHTEATVDLAVLAGLQPVGVLCELVNDDGTVQRLPQLVEFKKKFGLTMISTAQLIEYRARKERLVEKVSERAIDTEYGEFWMSVFRGKLDGREHFALTLGKLDGSPTLVRVHSADVAGDVFLEKGSGSQKVLAESLRAIRREGRGAVLYMEPSAGAKEMNLRDYGMGAQILVELGLGKIRLLSNSNRKLVGLDGYGLEVVALEKLEVGGQS